MLDLLLMRRSGDDSEREKAAPGDLVADLIRRRDVSTLLQPIVNLRTGGMLGFEALTRGPEGHPLHHADDLFAAAEAAGLVTELDRLCMEAAVRKHLACGNGWTLFLNLNPRTIDEPQLAQRLGVLMAVHGLLTAEHIVLEVTEQAMVTDFRSFRAVVERLRERGFRVAVDDVGAGYSNLSLVASLCPDLIKLDRSLIRELHASPTKRALVETFVAFAHRIDARVVAEGIESEQELRVVCAAGVDFGQGYLLGRPTPEPLAAPPPWVADVLRAAAGSPMGGGNPDITLGEAAVVAPEARRDARVAGILGQVELEQVLVVVDEERRPQGVVVKERLFHKLGRKYGFSVYAKRPVELVMDGAPVMPAHTPVVVVAQSMAARRDGQLDDYVVVVDEAGRYAGVLSSRRLLDLVARISIDMAKHANPLTGLPGNQQIEAELSRCISAGRPFHVIYADIDRFKLVNDRMGFAYGDGVIRLLADILQGAVRTHGAPADFVGHVGGDDFVVVTRAEQVLPLCQEVIDRFSRAVEPAVAGDLEPGVRPTISLAVVSGAGRSFTSVLELARVAAEVKRRVKERQGSAYVME